MDINAHEYLQTIALLNFLDEFICRELSTDGKDEGFDDVIPAVNVQQSTNNDGQTRRVDLLHVDLNVLAKVVLVKVHH